ncbi:MAG TPA: oligosaccharide flippase family protein [Candidatus Methanoperedens sp.]
MFGFKAFLSRIMGIGTVQRQSIVSFIWQVAFTFISFLSTMYFAHAAGAGILGAYFLFMAYFNIASMVTDGGFGVAAIKRISEGKDQNEYFSSFVILRCLFVVIVIAALIAFRGYFVDLNNSGMFVLLLFALIASILPGAVSSGVSGCGKIGIHATCDFIGSVSRILVQVAAIALGFGAWGLAGGFIAGLIVTPMLELRFFDLRFVRFSWYHIKSMLTFSFWLFLTTGGTIIYQTADTVMIGYYLDNANIGVYRVVVLFTGVSAIITGALHVTLWPKISRWGKTGNIWLIEESLSRSITYSLVFAIPIFAGGVLLGDKLLYFFYGAEFTKGYTTLVVMLMVQVVNVFQFFSLEFLGALDKQKEAFKITAAAATANIMVNAILIPIMGITGAGLATLITISLNAILARHVLSKTITMRVENSSIFNIIEASAAMVLLVGGYRMLVPLSNIWLTLVPVILGGIVYGFLMLKFDGKIYDELKGILSQMNITWPKWL